MLGKNLSPETALLDYAVLINNGTAPSFMERVMAEHTVIKASKVMAGTVVERNSDATEFKLQPPSKLIVKLWSDIGSETKRSVADLSVVVKTNVAAIGEDGLTS